MSDIQLSIEFGVSVLEKIVAAGYNFLHQEHQKRDFFGKATERYVQGLINRYSEVKVLGMNRPVPLLSLYVRANILEKITARMGAKLEDLETFFNQDRHAFGKPKATKDGEQIANELDRFIVLGKPGAGKTTFLRYLALAMVHRQSTIQKRRLPIFITLRDWADKKCNLMAYITDQFDICGFEQAGIFVEHLLRQGDCLILFDGLDEVSQEANLDGIIRDIRDFTDKYSDNQFILSCRIAAYNHWFDRFTDVEIADFNEKQIEQFIRNWFHREPKTGEECLKHLKNNPQLEELSSVPLLLTLLCITYEENNYFPSNKAELYKETLEALLKKWDSSRLVRRDDPYKQLSLMQKENMFARIAIGAFTENRYFMREVELTKMIGNFIDNLPAFKSENLKADGAEVLRTIAVHHGIFLERAKHIHSFAHLTFQEYFTAKYIVDNDNAENRQLEKLVQEHLYDAKWKEVFLLAVGMVSSADELLLAMQKKNRELLREPLLNNLLHNATRALLPTKTNYTPEVRKAVFLFLIFANSLDLDNAYNHTLTLTLNRTHVGGPASDHAFTLALTRDLTHDLDLAHDLVRDLSHDLARDLDLSLAHDLASASDLDRAFTLYLAHARYFVRARAYDSDTAYVIASDFANGLVNDLSHVLNIASAIARYLAGKTGPSKKQIHIVESINNFLKANLLIVYCLQSGTHVTKSTREHILSQLFEPLSDAK